MDHSDRELRCASCGQRFLFSSGEQAYYAQNGLQDPRRCKPCRAQRKAQGAQGGERSHRGGSGRPERRGGGSHKPQRSGTWLPSPDDPNGYRAPAFQSETRGAYAIDYEGLPRDEEDGDAPAPAGHDGIDRFGMRTEMRGGAPGPRGPRGGRGPRRDRSGTDPDAYRAPAFTNSDPAAPRHGAAAGTSRRARRAQRMRHEATCGDCGVQALVPFQPGPDRPAYCKSCYQVRKANGTVMVPGAGAPAADPAPATPAALADGAGE
jgi:CxxC-x17-CxxC domain-containing protein